jgi:hypothetical protein
MPAGFEHAHVGRSGRRVELMRDEREREREREREKERKRKDILGSFAIWEMSWPGRTNGRWGVGAATSACCRVITRWWTRDWRRH